MRLSGKAAAVVAGTAALALSLTACGTKDGDKGDTDSPKAAGPVTVSWWGWAPGYESAAAAFNAAHTDVQIRFEQVSAGSQGGYDKMLTAVKAGNAPCLGQVGAETFTSFLAQGALEDVTEHLAGAKADFPEAAWKTVSLGEKIYGVPVDSGAMGLFYRADLFQQYGLAVPTTWDEFKAAGQKLHAADPTKYIANLPTDAYNFSGYSWQAGARWFSAADDAWEVTIDSPANVKVADFWQSMVDEGSVSTFPSWDAALNAAWADGAVLSEVGAVWTAGILESEAKASAGKWAVAPMPKWQGSDAVGNVGGSPNAVLKGCPNPKEAAEAALWLSTNADSLNLMIDEGGLYPASTAGQALPIMKQGREFFGGQAIFEVFAAESAHVNPDWQWGPVMTVTSTALADGLGKVGNKSGTVADALAAAQTKTVEEIEAQGYALKK
ncbi:MAG: sugar ABC transporter substrate-binding protein [Bifidobacteriaceae bacterium]|jgi:multiple sugar transport system substrate-binding protein|nr:sugar ABC transporter substrate-binding protein [Bifidobacteriaceae bacterium]